MKSLIISAILKMSKCEKYYDFDNDVSNDLNARRYHQLVDMMNFFNTDFDEKKYWAYGCNCLIIGTV